MAAYPVSGLKNFDDLVLVLLCFWRDDIRCFVYAIGMEKIFSDIRSEPFHAAFIKRIFQYFSYLLKSFLVEFFFIQEVFNSAIYANESSNKFFKNITIIAFFQSANFSITFVQR